MGGSCCQNLKRYELLDQRRPPEPITSINEGEHVVVFLSKPMSSKLELYNMLVLGVTS